MKDLEKIRNFSIIAHIDHGKSTLADRLIQITGGLDLREMKDQVLDTMDLERERGITIKAQAVTLKYKSNDNEEYTLNIIDTPGHVDFAYEVNRSLAACEGSILIVDASQGVEAQTLANVYQAISNNHEILIALNKIDLPASEPERVKAQIEDVIGLDTSDAIEISAKTGDGIEDLLEEIIKKLPAPTGNHMNPTKALLVDSWYDAYLGVIVLIRVIEGSIKKGQKIKLMSTAAVYQIERIGIFQPKQMMLEQLGPGEIGFFTASIKQVSDMRVGDTITDDRIPCQTPLEGFKPAQPVVFCGLYPQDTSDFESLRDSIEKLSLNDASFFYEKESSVALGLGYRCGFLGLLHLEIICERIDREYNIDLVTTAPSVIYKVHTTDSKSIDLHNPVDLPPQERITRIEEPWILASIIVPE